MSPSTISPMFAIIGPDGRSCIAYDTNAGSERGNHERRATAPCLSGRPYGAANEPGRPRLNDDNIYDNAARGFAQFFCATLRPVDRVSERCGPRPWVASDVPWRILLLPGRSCLDIPGYRRAEPIWITNRIVCLVIAAECVRLLEKRDPLVHKLTAMLAAADCVRKVLRSLKRSHNWRDFPDEHASKARLDSQLVRLSRSLPK